MNVQAPRAGRVVQRSDGRPARKLSPAFEVGSRDSAGARVVWCRGELDISSEEQVMTEVARALGTSHTTLLLDLKGLTFADCTVLRCIEYAAAACERCHVTLYVDPGETVRKLARTLPAETLGGAAAYL